MKEVNPIVWVFLRWFLIGVLVYAIVAGLFMQAWNISLPVLGVPVLSYGNAVGFTGLGFLILAALIVSFRNFK